MHSVEARNALHTAVLASIAGDRMRAFAALAIFITSLDTPLRSPMMTFDVWGWDLGMLGIRLYWTRNLGLPRMEKDPWCWHFTAGPLYLSGGRIKRLRALGYGY